MKCYSVFKYNPITREIGEHIKDVFGEYVLKDKNNPEISSGYMYYIKSGSGYEKYSAFSFILKECENKISPYDILEVSNGL